MKIRAVIVSNDGSARSQLSGLLRTESDVEIVGTCGRSSGAIALVKRLNPDVVFLDVLLPDTGDLAMLEALDPMDPPLVVLISTHDRYAARAFEMGVTDYLLKPFDSRRFGVALARVRKELTQGADAPRRPTLPRANGSVAITANAPKPTAPSRPEPGLSLDRIMVRDRGRIYFVRTSEIDWIESADNYVRLHVAKNIHLIRHSLKHLGARLDAGQFARIHRCTIVNLDRVREIQPGIGREHIVILEDGTRLKLSLRYRRLLERQAEHGR